MAPMIDAMMPGPLAPDWYQPRARPMNPATSEPAMPSSIVMMTPPGSLPGMNSFANAPTTKPMMSDHKMCILPSPSPSSCDETERHQAQPGFSWQAPAACHFYCPLGLTPGQQDHAAPPFYARKC